MSVPMLDSASGIATTVSFVATAALLPASPALPALPAPDPELCACREDSVKKPWSLLPLKRPLVLGAGIGCSLLAFCGSAACALLVAPVALRALLAVPCSSRQTCSLSIARCGLTGSAVISVCLDDSGSDSCCAAVILRDKS